GTFVVTSVTANSFTYSVGGAPNSLAASGGGTATAADLVTITTTAPHTFVVGQTVVVANVGVDGYNGTFVVTAVTPTTFKYMHTLTGLPASGGGPVTAGVVAPVVATTAIAASPSGATESGNTVTISTGTVPHGLSVGQTVSISGVGIGAVAGIS